jgi:hypothetical protein
MSDIVAVIDQQGLALLIGRLDLLRQRLHKIYIDREESFIRKRNHTLKAEDDIDEGTLTRRMACSQLIAVLEFIEDSETLAPDLHKLLHALLDIERGQHVAWMEPKKRRGRPRPSYMDVTAHARYAWVMDFLIEKGNKGENEAAHFVVEYGGLRSWLKHRSQKNSAADLQVVKNWRDRIKGGSCTQEESIAFATTADLVGSQLDTPQDVEHEAKKLLRGIKIYFNGG